MKADWEKVEAKIKEALLDCAEDGTIVNRGSGPVFSIGGEVEYFRKLIDKLNDDERVVYFEEIFIQYLSPGEISVLFDVLKAKHPVIEAVVTGLIQTHSKHGLLNRVADEV